MDNNLLWVFEQRCKKAVAALMKNEFDAVYCESREEARRNIIDEARKARTIGFGGSMTVRELQLEPDLEQTGAELLQHNKPGLSAE